MPESESDRTARRQAFIKSVASQTERSPFAQIVRAEGGELFPRVIAHRHQAFWNATKDHIFGNDKTVLTDLGKKRSTNRDIWKSGKQLAAKAVKFAPPATKLHMTESFNAMDEPRGDLVVEDFAKKVMRYAPGHTPGELSDSGRRLMHDALVQVFDNYQKQFRAAPAPKFSEIHVWISQMTPNKNSGNPDYSPLSIEQIVNEYWPVLRNTLMAIVGGDMEAKQPPYTDPVYAGFHRSRDRPIHGSGIFDKMLGAFLNYFVVNTLKMDSHIAWNSLEDLWRDLADPMDRAESTLHNDFKAYDGHFSADINTMIRDAFLESTMFEDKPEYRNVFLYFCNQLVRSDSVLQVSPTHAFEMRAALFSGIPVTQWWGCIFHEAFYIVLEEEYSAGILEYKVLSDDGMAVLDRTVSEAQAFMEGPVVELCEMTGMTLNAPKSYCADLTHYTTMHPDADWEIHDMGPFLQTYPQRDPMRSYANVPRKIAGLFEKERDSSDITRAIMLAQYAPSLTKHKLGQDVRKTTAGWVTDMHRSLDVLGTIRPSYQRVREVMIWFSKVYPNFWKKFKILHDAADKGLWEERSLMAGGTRQGLSPKWVVDTYRAWMDEGGSAPSLSQMQDIGFGA
jgi:hypothetical protein